MENSSARRAMASHRAGKQLTPLAPNAPRGQCVLCRPYRAPTHSPCRASHPPTSVKQLPKPEAPLRRTLQTLPDFAIAVRHQREKFLRSRQQASAQLHCARATSEESSTASAAEYLTLDRAQCACRGEETDTDAGVLKASEPQTVRQLNLQTAAE